jgi:hypothetical protein
MYISFASTQKVVLFVCFESHEQFFSYLATVTITGDRAANLDLFLALTAFFYVPKVGNVSIALHSDNLDRIRSLLNSANVHFFF